MNKLTVLMKNEFFNITGFNKLRRANKSSDRVRSVSIFAAMIFVIVSLLGSAIAYYSVMADALEPVGALGILPIFAIFFASVAVLFTTLYTAQGMIFTFKDFDLLMAMPIKERTILASKILLFMLMNVVASFVVIVPAAVIYYVRTMPSPVYLLFAFIVSVAVPILPILISSLIALGISYLSSRFRHKNLLITVISFGLIILFMLGSFMGKSLMEQLIGSAAGIGEMLGKIYPVGMYFCDALTKLDVVSLLMGILWSVVPFALFLFLFSKVYRRINLKLSETYQRGSYQLGALKTSSPLKALLLKELKFYFSTPIYVLNTFMGSVLMVVLAVGVVFAGGEIVAQILKVPQVAGQLPYMLIVAYSAMVVLSCTSCTSVSLEGSNFWIIRSMPVKTSAVFLAKMSLNVLITLPFVILSGIVLHFALGLSAVQTFYLMLIPSLYSFLSSQLGLFINLLVPKMEWTTPMVVVKQSMSVMIALFANAVLVAVPTVLYILMQPADTGIFLLFAALGLAVLNIALAFLLRTSGKKLYYKIEV